MYLPSDPRLEWSGRGHHSSHPWAIIYVRPGAPFQVKGTSVNLYHMQLNMFIKFIENTLPINQQRKLKIHCLSICVCGKDDQRYSIVCNVKNIDLFAYFGVSFDLYHYLSLSCINEYFYPVAKDY